MPRSPLPRTGRQRMESVFRKQAEGRSLCWTTLVDGNTLQALPGELAKMTGIEFYRHIGCDILMLDGWGTLFAFKSPRLQWAAGVTDTSRETGPGEWTRELRSPHGTLTSVSRNGHPVKMPVTTLEEVRLYRRFWEDATYLEADDSETFAAINRAIGEDGIVTRFLGPSTIPRLLETDLGTENFYYLYHDHPEEVKPLIALMHERELDAFRIAARGPGEVMIIAENTSTYYISPWLYEEHNGPHLKDFVDIVHAAGKTAILHMCGHVKNLLPLIRHTGLDGIHALTPPPTGDTPWELALDVLGEDLIIVGALDPTIFVLGPLAGISQALDALYTPRLRKANFILGPFADGIPVPLERFLALSAWMQQHGGR